jgi:hypothetical protein
VERRLLCLFATRERSGVAVCAAARTLDDREWPEMLNLVGLREDAAAESAWKRGKTDDRTGCWRDASKPKPNNPVHSSARISRNRSSL